MKARWIVAAEKLFWKHHAGPPWASHLVGTGQAFSNVLKDKVFLNIASDDPNYWCKNVVIRNKAINAGSFGGKFTKCFWQKTGGWVIPELFVNSLSKFIPSLSLWCFFYTIHLGTAKYQHHKFHFSSSCGWNFHAQKKGINDLF